MNPFENRYKIKNQLVTVLWVDITSDSNWKEPIDFDKESLPICVSTGYLWSKNKNFVKLFADFSLKDNGEIDDLGNTTIIPTSVIIKIIDPITYGKNQRSKAVVKNKKLKD
jgi:hypothetical protein